jgi:hypothetical protein
VFAVLPLLLALFAVVVIAVLHADLSGPRPLPAEQFNELSANLDVVKSVESCGQGRRPVDCGAVVIIAGDAELDERAVLEEVRNAWCRDPWRCEQDEDGQVVARIRASGDGKTRCRYGSAALVVFRTGRTTASR